MVKLSKEEEHWWEKMSSGCVALYTGAGDAAYIANPGYQNAPGQQAEWQRKEEQDKPLRLPHWPSSVSALHLPKLSSFSSRRRPLHLSSLCIVSQSGRVSA